MFFYGNNTILHSLEKFIIEEKDVMERFKKILKIMAKIFGVLIVLGIILAYPGYKLAEYSFNRYFREGGERLIELDRRNMLPKIGAAAERLKAKKDFEEAGGDLVKNEDLSRYIL